MSPAQVKGGMSSTGTVTLTGAAPVGGIVVKVTSSQPSVASVPATVTVPYHATSASFRITTRRVLQTTTMTISSAYAGTTRTAPLTVTR